MNNILLTTIVSTLTTIFIFLMELFTINIVKNFIPDLIPILNQENFLFLFFLIIFCFIQCVYNNRKNEKQSKFLISIILFLSSLLLSFFISFCGLKNIFQIFKQFFTTGNPNWIVYLTILLINYVIFFISSLVIFTTPNSEENNSNDIKEIIVLIILVSTVFSIASFFLSIPLIIHYFISKIVPFDPLCINYSIGAINWLSIITIFLLYLILYVPLYSLLDLVISNLKSLFWFMDIFYFFYYKFAKKEYFDCKEAGEELIKVISKTIKKSKFNPKILRNSSLFKSEVRKISKKSKLKNFLDKNFFSDNSYGKYIDCIDDEILNLYFNSDDNINYRLDLIKSIFETNIKRIQESCKNYFIEDIMDAFYQILELDKIKNPPIKYKNVKLNNKIFEKLYKIGLINTSDKFALSFINIPKIFKFENKYYKITKISKKFFKDCTSLKEIIIPESVKKIDNYAFKNCKNLKRISFPTNLIEIGIGTFENCLSLSNECYNFDFLLKIGKYAFKNCKNIKSLSIKKELKKIEKGTFENCNSLKHIYFGVGNEPKEIEDYAFKNCKALDIYSSRFEKVKYIGQKAFYGCKSLEEVDFDNILQIGVKAFAYCSFLKKVDISDTIEEIGDYAFKNCKLLNQIVIPNKVKKIGIGAFQNIENIIYGGNLNTSNFYSKNVTREIYVDLNCDILQKLYEQEPFRFKFSDDEINKPFDEIKDKIISVEVPEKFIYEGLNYNIIKLKGAFYNLESLKTVTLPNTITEIGNGAFEACESLTEIVIPDSVTIFGYNVFDFCTKLTNAKLSKNLVQIDNFCFAHCYSLKEIRIPDSVKYIGRGAFLYCTKLEKVKLPKDITKIEANTFNACHLLNDIDIPNSVTEIGDYAFKNCDNSFNFKIPKSVKKMGKDIFAKEYSSYWPLTGYKAIL